MSTFYATDGLISADLEETSTTPNFSLGQTVQGNDGSEWVYVRASGVIDRYDYVQVSETFVATATVLATGSLGDIGAVACSTAFANNEYGWVCRKGAGANFKVLVGASCVANALLYTTTVAGGLDDATVSGADRIDGVVIYEAAPTTAGTHAVGAIIDYPKFGAQS
jgi:hypothetical protein